MKVVLIPGDGIGPEVAAAAREVVAATGVTIDWGIAYAGAGAAARFRDPLAVDPPAPAPGVPIDWVIAYAGAEAAERFGDPLPEATLALVREHRVALKGPCTTPIGEGFRSINVRMRQ